MTRRRVQLVLLVGVVLVAMAIPGAVRADEGDGPPTLFCAQFDDAGLTWPVDDPATDEVEFYCARSLVNGVYVYAWKLRVKNTSAKVSSAFVAGSTTWGCLTGQAAITSDAAGAASNIGIANVIAQTITGTTCDAEQVSNQPTGEIRARATIERLSGGSWGDCVTTGYQYSNVTSYDWHAGFNMGTGPDCGGGLSYRTQADLSVYQGGAWRNGTIYSGSFVMP